VRRPGQSSALGLAINQAGGNGLRAPQAWPRSDASQMVVVR
jgi:hypothetical protein